MGMSNNIQLFGPLGNVETEFLKNSSYAFGRLVIVWMVAVRSIIKVVFSLMFLTQPSALESFNAILTVNTAVAYFLMFASYIHHLLQSLKVLLIRDTLKQPPDQ